MTLESRYPVHPHACGEQIGARTREEREAGSSPRVWGTDLVEQRPIRVRRFIPTRVGNSPHSRRKALPVSVHPHACGEQADARYSAAFNVGSSPRVWGTGVRLSLYGPLHRFIPTRVGNRSRHGGACYHSTVHPHACGEQGTLEAPAGAPSGSSPRVWGTGSRACSLASGCRFIPTRVGNRPRQRASTFQRTVHPHACGEQLIGALARAAVFGSSPRVWGTARQPRRQDLQQRFIPTRVGNSSLWPGTVWSRSVHPHACGEQKIISTCPPSMNGSSPRVWGTVDVRLFIEHPFRFIPTRVGNSSRPTPA